MSFYLILKGLLLFHTLVHRPELLKYSKEPGQCGSVVEFNL